MDITKQNTTPLPANTLRRAVLMVGLDIADQNTTPLLASVIEQRERIALMRTIELEPLVPQGQGQTSQHRHQIRAYTFWPTLQRVLQRVYRRRRVPQLSQMSAVECGAACLAMILLYYGRKTSVSEIREHCSVGRDGLSALSIVKAAREYGLRVRAVSLQENDFRFITLPAIVHWEFNHFLIVERWSPHMRRCG